MGNPRSKAQCWRSNNDRPGEIFIFSVADGTAQLFGRDTGVRESTLRLEQLVTSEDLRRPADETREDAESPQ